MPSKALFWMLLAMLVPAANGAEMYERDDGQSIDSTYNLDYVDLVPAFLLSRFGEPAEGDGIRVSGIYTFVSKRGETFTLHDYKSTTLWATDEGLPSVDEFWSSRTNQEISVGGRSGTDYEGFVEWLLKEQATWLAHRE